MNVEEALKEFEKRTQKRAMIFIELVRGCENTTCPSYGMACKAGRPMEYMSLPTLMSILEEIKSCQNVLSGFQSTSIWAYGCGDPTRHPKLKDCCKLLYSELPKSYDISMSIDSHSRVRNDGWAEFCRPKIIHKLPIQGWLDDAEWWNREYPNLCSHGFILKHVSKELFQQIMDLPSKGAKKGRTFHLVDFGSDQLAENVKAYGHLPITFDDSLTVKRYLYDGPLAQRTMFAVDGSLRKCLLATTTAKSFRDLLLEPIFNCANCFRTTGGERVYFSNQGCEVEEFACCVSHDPL